MRVTKKNYKGQIITVVKSDSDWKLLNVIIHIIKKSFTVSKHIIKLNLYKLQINRNIKTYSDCE